MTAAEVFSCALRPQTKRYSISPRPTHGLPVGEVVVATAYDEIWRCLPQSPFHSPVHQKTVSADPPSPGGKYLVGKTNFIFIDEPLALTAIVFRQEDDVQIDLTVLRERVENRDSVRCDNLRNNYEPAAHATHSR